MFWPLKHEEMRLIDNSQCVCVCVFRCLVMLSHVSGASVAMVANVTVGISSQSQAPPVRPAWACLCFSCLFVWSGLFRSHLGIKPTTLTQYLLLAHLSISLCSSWPKHHHVFFNPTSFLLLIRMTQDHWKSPSVSKFHSTWMTAQPEFYYILQPLDDSFHSVKHDDDTPHWLVSLLLFLLLSGTSPPLEGLTRKQTVKLPVGDSLISHCQTSRELRHFSESCAHSSTEFLNCSVNNRNRGKEKKKSLQSAECLRNGPKTHKLTGRAATKCVNVRERSPQNYSRKGHTLFIFPSQILHLSLIATLQTF